MTNAATIAALAVLTGAAIGTSSAASASSEQVLYAFGQAKGDAQLPHADLINVGGTFYGTSYHGGTGARSGNCGTVFAVNPATGAETVVYSFKGGSDGAYPQASLIDVGGTLYGTTNNGGTTTCSSGCGTVFSVAPSTGAKTVLYEFKGYPCDGAYPFAGLLNLAGTLYGTTNNGGAHGYGTVFTVTP
jgi:uncharacterized repeat protein (TIGR03803 family)